MLSDDRARTGRRAAHARLSVVVAVLLLAPSVAFAQVASLLGTPGDDTINGTPRADTILGLAGNDKIDGAAGNDDIDGGPGADDIRGGPGTDAVLYGDQTTALSVTLDDVANDGEAGNDNVHSDIEQIFGGTAGDILTGNGRSNLIDGGGGGDSITDGGGTDRVYGGDGDDVIATFDGNDDIVDCGLGNDTVTSDRADLLIHCETHLPARRVGARISASFELRGGRARVNRLTVSEIPSDGRVELRCRGGCPIQLVRIPIGRTKVDLATQFQGRRLARGTTVEVRITQPGSIGKVRVFRIGRTDVPYSDLCLPPGGKSARKQC